MDRKHFLKQLSALGIGSVFAPSLLSSCDPTYDFYPAIDVNFSGKVLIIGAGSAGLMAGHVLNQYGIEFEILEASDRYGGRVKKTEDLADFPIDLGAEWIHTHPSILAKLLNDRNENASIDFINYTPETFGFYNNGKLKDKDFVSNFYGEWKFKDSTWFDYFDEFIVPDLANRLILNSPVQEIDYSRTTIQVTTTDSTVYSGDRVIVTVPLTMLKNNSITFLPELPSDKVNALNQVDMPDGLKVFIEMEENFYPDITVVGGLFDFIGEDSGEALYYNAAFRKDTNRNVLALFGVGDPIKRYTGQGSHDNIIDYIMTELDEIFSGSASRKYVQHVVQNWTSEPYIMGSYSHYDNYSALDVLARPIDGKVYFAGEAYSDESQATVHGAAETAWRAVRQILQG